jgi:hypothetical protein
VLQARPVVEPNTPFVDGWHLDAICEHLDACVRGEVRWQGTSPYPAEALLAAPANDGEAGRLEEAREVLLELLRDGARPTITVEAEARAAGIAVRTLRRARASLQVRSTKTGAGGAWELALPPAPLAELHRQTVMTADETQAAKAAKAAKDASREDAGPLDEATP